VTAGIRNLATSLALAPSWSRAKYTTRGWLKAAEWRVQTR
jgi:hypothetical protein